MLGPVPIGLPVVVIRRRAFRGQAKGLVNKQESWTNVTIMRRWNSKKKKKKRRGQLEKPKIQDGIIRGTRVEGKETNEANDWKGMTE